MSIQILIGGVDYTQYVSLQSVKVESNIAVTSDTFNLDIKIPQKIVPRPKGGQEIKLINGSTTEYGGVILTPKETALATDRMLYKVQCRDYIYYFDKRVVTNTYSGFTIGNIVKDVVSNFTTGFTSNNVSGTNLSFYLSQIKFDHWPPSKVLKKLADDTAFQWWIDYSKDVHFGVTSSNPSPLPSNTLLVDSDIANYSELEFDEDVSQLRNQIYLQGFKVPALYTVTQNFTTDGQNNSFSTTYEPKHDLAKITVTLNGVPQAKKLDIAGGQPNNTLQDNTAYVNYIGQSYRFNVTPPANQVLSVTYYPLFETVRMYNDPNAMAIMKDRDLQDGVYEFAIRDKQLTSIDSALANTRGQLELYKYAYPHYSGQFYSYLQGWQPGQFFYLTSDNRMDGYFQNFMFYVVKVGKEIVTHPSGGTPTLKYTVYFSDTPYVF